MIKRLLPFLPLFLVFFAGVLGTLDLWHGGFPLTHDGDVHLVRLTNFYQILSEGIWLPRWAANVNWGYGQPVFEFFYPLPSYISSLLHVFGFSFANSFKFLLGLSIVLSGITMFVWLRQFSTRWGAFFGAFLYMFAPYRLVDVYVRGDIGETLALVFVPVVLYFLAVSFRRKSKYPVLFGGISLALLILCHNIVSLMTLPFILFYAVYLWFLHKRTKIDGAKILAIIACGFLLSAFFWLPGLIEGKYTLRDIVTRGGYLSSFVSWPALFWGKWSYGISGQFTVQLGIAQWIILFGSILLLFVKKQAHKFFIFTLLFYSVVAIFLMLPVSNVVWSKIILLQNFQFPWRFLLVTIFTSSVLGALLVDSLSKKFRIVSIFVLIGVCLLAEHSYLHAKAYVQRPDSTYAGVFKGPSDTGESSPIWGIRFMESGYTMPLEVLSGKALIKQTSRTSTKHTYMVRAETQTKFMENTMYFPGWHVLVDGKETPVEFQDEQHRGIMEFFAPQGEHTIRVVFTDTKFREIADDISIVSFLLVVLLLIPLPKRFTIPL